MQVPSALLATEQRVSDLQHALDAANEAHTIVFANVQQQVQHPMQFHHRHSNIRLAFVPRALWLHVLITITHQTTALTCFVGCCVMKCSHDLASHDQMSSRQVAGVQLETVRRQDFSQEAVTDSLRTELSAAQVNPHVSGLCV
jgi:hypothetical protein